MTFQAPGQVSTGIVLTARGAVGVQARAGAGQIEVLAREVVELPPGCLEGGAVRDAGLASAAIQALVRRLGRSRSALMVLPSASYSMRTVRLPDVPVAEQRSLVRNELEQAGAFPAVGGGGLDFFWLTTQVSGTVQADAFAYFTSEAVVTGLRAAARQAGLRMGGLEPASLASMRAYMAAAGQYTPVALLYPAEKYCDLCIHDGRGIRHVRRIPAGRADLKEIEDQREATGRTGGVREHHGRGAAGTPVPGIDELDLTPPGGGGAGSSAPEAAEGPRIGRSLLQDTPFIASEVSRSLAFYAREHPDAPRPESLVILGGVEGARGLHRLLDGTLAIPVTTVESVRPLADLAREEAADELLAALGAAADRLV